MAPKVTGEYPQEYYIELVSLSPEIQGRITVDMIDGKFNATIDLVFSETGKIYNHIKTIYKCDDKRDALDLGMFHLKKYFDSLR